MTAKHMLAGGDVFVQAEDGGSSIRASVLAAHDKYDAVLLALEEPVHSEVFVPTLLRDPLHLNGKPVSLHVISPLHKGAHTVPNYAIGSYDAVNGHYELSPDNAKGHSGGVVVWRDTVVGLLVARAPDQPLCRAISLDRLFAWVCTNLPGLEFPSPPPAWRVGTSPLLARVVAFRESYLVEDGHIEPFGGRDEEMSNLDAWLDGDETPNHLLLSGPTGRGKTALLVRWTERLAQSDAWKIAFVPVSVRFETHQPALFYEILASQLAQLAGQTMEAPAFDPENYFLGKATALLSELSSTTEKILVVIDGIDEALDQRFNSTVFPRSLPANIKIICSAREQANDDGAKGWLRRLDWDRPQFAVSQSLALLGVKEVRGILQNAQIVDIDDGSLAARIADLSEGEPLLIKLYVEDLAVAAANGGHISSEQLAGLNRGFGSYFELALDNQRRIWEASNSKVDPDIVDVTLAVLAAALGPLTGQSLLRLICALAKTPERFSVDSFIKPIARFVIGNGRNGSGYVLNHPKLGQFLREEKFDETVLRRVHAAFVHWGQEEARASEADAGALIAPYILQHFARHVERAKEERRELWWCLSNGWRLAWERHEGGFHGYSGSLLSILEMLKRNDERWPFPESVRFRIKLALCVASIKSVGANVPAELLRLALETGQLTLRQTMQYVQLQSSENQANFFAEIFAHLSKDGIDDALISIRSVLDSCSRAHYLARVVSLLPDERRGRVVDEVKHLVTSFDTAQTFPIGVELAECLSSQQLSELASQAESLTAMPEHMLGCIVALGKLSSICLARGEMMAYGRVLRSCLSMLDSIAAPIGRTDALCQVSRDIPRLEVESRVSQLSETITDISRDPERDIRQQSSRSETIVLLDAARVRKICIGFEILRLQSNPVAQKVQGLQALESLAQRTFEFDGSEAFSYAMPLFAGENQAEVAMRGFEIARSLPTGNNRAYALMSLAKSSPEHLRPRFVREAIISARLIEDDVSQLESLIGLAAQLPGDERMREVDALRQASNRIAYVLTKGQTLMRLAAIAPNPEELQTAGVQLIRQTADRHFSMGPLLHALKELSESHRRTIFREYMEEEFRLADNTMWIRLPLAVEAAADLWTQSDVRRASARVAWFQDPLHKAYILCALAAVDSNSSPSGLFARAVTAVCEINDPGTRLVQLAKLVSKLPESDQRRRLVDEEWLRSVNAGYEINLGHLMVAFPQLGLENQRRAREQVMRIISQGGDTTGSLSTQLAKLTTDREGRAGLQQSAMLALASVKGEPRCFGAIDLLLLAETDAEQRSALVFAFDDPVQARSSILTTIGRVAPVIFRIGSTDLIQEVMSDVREIASWWP
jgi:hypothetical protein